jgi:hypothetical protein
VNSGLAAYPASYTRVWSGAGGAIWRPAPPPGYVAAGDLFTSDDQEPELSDVICLHGEVVPADWHRAYPLTFGIHVCGIGYAPTSP